MIHPFDSDTALEPTGAGRWRASVSEHWFVESGPNGGFIAALAARAMGDLAGPDRPPRLLTLHYLAPPRAGPIVLEAGVERAGRSTTFVSLRLRQDDRTVALGLGCSAVWRDDQPAWDALERPGVPPPGEVAPLAHIEGTPRFLANYELRPLDAPRVGGWIRTARPRAADPILFAALTDAWVPSAFPKLEHPSFVPTIDLTIHWRAPADAAPGEHPFVLGLFSTRLGAGGVWEEDGELWSEDGVLLAQSRQLAMVRGPRA